MKTKLIVLITIACLLLSGCIQIEISIPGADKPKVEEPQETEDTMVVADYPSAIGTDEEKLLIRLLPDEVFETTAEENGLDGTLYQIYGTVEKVAADSDGTMNVIHLRTHKGDIVISNVALSMSSDSSFSKLGAIDADTIEMLCPIPQEGEFCRIFAEYQGFSEKYKAPYFIYGGTDYLAEALLSSIELN